MVAPVAGRRLVGTGAALRRVQVGVPPTGQVPAIALMDRAAAGWALVLQIASMVGADEYDR
jgi:hypothetical protein